MRLAITEEELRVIISSLLLSKKQNTAIIRKLLFQRRKSKNVSDKKRNATQKARKVHSDATKSKIQDAISLLKIENIPITKKLIKDKSGVSYSSIRKYVDESFFI